MTRTFAALIAALLATGARAQTPDPAAAQPAATPAAAPAPAPAPAKKAEKGTYVVGEKSKISLSGRAWAQFENLSASHGSSASGVKMDSRWRLQNNSSYLRIRGETELEYGFKALAQIEAEFGIEGEAGVPFSGTRNTGVGLSHPVYGTVILGRWDSPMKQTTIGLDPWGGTGVHGYYNVFGQQQASATGSGSNRWDRRLNNSINYTSPTYQGVTALVSYSVGETRDNASIKVEPYTISGALQYKRGPIYAGVAYEARNDCGNPDADGTLSPPAASCNQSALGSATQAKGLDQGFRAGASYAVKQTGTKVALAYEYIDLYTAPVAGVAHKSLQRSAYWGAITQSILEDEHQALLTYGEASSVGGQGVFADERRTGASYFTLGYREFLGKDFDVTLAYTLLKNRGNASYRFGSNNFGSVPVGSTSTAYSLAVRYFF